MSERKGKASELVDDLIRRSTTKEAEEERARRRGPRPKLRLRREVLDRAVGSDASVREVLERQTGEDLTVLRDDETGKAAVVLPLEQYLELVTSEIRDARQWVATLNGGMQPHDVKLTELGVEQVNPDESWVRAGNP